MMRTVTTWIQGREFESENNNQKIRIDSGGGFRAKALLLSGLSACSGIDVVEILEKMRVPFRNLEIDAQAETSDSDPKVFLDILLTYKVEIEEEYRPKLQKAIDLSLEKYCGVAAMLKKNSPIRYEIQIHQNF